MAFTQKMTRDYIDHMILINYIITLPHHSTCTISTDSANCISTYQQRLNSPTLSPRRQLKQTNFLIWNLIFWLIHHQNITQKVKAHSNDPYNEKAELLATDGANVKQPISKLFGDSSLGFIKQKNLYIVDQNIRRWSSTPIQARVYNELINNSSLKPVGRLQAVGTSQMDRLVAY